MDYAIMSHDIVVHDLLAHNSMDGVTFANDLCVDRMEVALMDDDICG